MTISHTLTFTVFTSHVVFVCFVIYIEFRFNGQFFHVFFLNFVAPVYCLFVHKKLEHSAGTDWLKQIADIIIAVDGLNFYWWQIMIGLVLAPCKHYWKCIAFKSKRDEGKKWVSWTWIYVISLHTAGPLYCFFLLCLVCYT